MDLQSLTVALLVAISFAYAAWTLMPQVLRAALARGLLRLPLPAFARQRVVKAAVASPGCACAGCDKAPVAAQGAGSGKLSAEAQPIVFHHRKKA